MDAALFDILLRGDGDDESGGVGSGVFAQYERDDMQGVCVNMPPQESAAFRPLLPPFFAELLSLNWWTAKFTWAYFNFNLAQWLHELVMLFSHQGNLTYRLVGP